MFRRGCAGDRPGSFHFLYAWFGLLACLLIGIPGEAWAGQSRPGSGAPEEFVRLPGHAIPAIAGTIRLAELKAGAAHEASPESKDEPLFLTIVLNRRNQAGFEQYLRSVYDPDSPKYRRFLSQKQITDRFGPTARAYQDVATYMQRHGFTVMERSANRMTLTVRGSRAMVEQTFQLRIDEYALGNSVFYAASDDPALPAAIAANVSAITGLSNAGVPHRATVEQGLNICGAAATVFGVIPVTAIGAAIVGAICTGIQIGLHPDQLMNYCGLGTTILSHWMPLGSAGINAICDGIQIGGDPPGAHLRASVRTEGTMAARALPGYVPRAPGLFAHNPPTLAGGNLADGAGQTVGIVAFDSFRAADVANFLNIIGAQDSQMGNLATIPVNGGVAAPGINQVEVLLDIIAVMTIAPGARVEVYQAPFGGQVTSYAAVFNAMINNGVTVITNSWASCENQVSLAESQGIDSVLQNAAASGISVFNATGDTGSTCLNGSPNTITVPANSPSATAVGGTTLRFGEGFVYGSETWWDGTAAVPPTGQGGFGVSRYFARPAYQDGLNPSPMRSIPDVAVNADPATGIVICQDSDDGCPSGKLHGGTSLSAPVWAAFTALLNQARGSNLGGLNQQIYPLANSAAFHGAASMGTDFGHVGLGSPNLDALHLLLSGGIAGPMDADVSRVRYESSIVEGLHSLLLASVPADGQTAAVVLVTLRDANGHTIGGKSITLTADQPGTIITPVNPVTSQSNGSSAFRITSLTPNAYTFTATNASDGIELTEKPTVFFGVPRAVSASVTANPPIVTANGNAVITVTLRDSLNRPTPGKLIKIAQGNGHSILTGPTPSVTDSNGEIQFIARNPVNETVTYTAVDVSDGNLAIPGSPQVTFTGGSGAACGQSGLPVAAAGYQLTPFATGFDAGPFFFANVNWNGCPGASNPAFSATASFMTNFKTGGIHRLALDGGNVSTGNLLATLSPTLGSPTFGKGGQLYAIIAATSSANNGSIVELDPGTGALVRTVASGLTCPNGLAVDPISGDLFFDDQCFGAGLNNPNVFRVVDPTAASPAVVTYATLPASPNALMAFAPNGSLYVVSGYGGASAPVYRVSGTDTATPGLVSPTLVSSDYSLAIGETLPDGEAKSLIVHFGNDMRLVDISTGSATVLASGGLVAGVNGPDGCLYMTTGDTVYKLSAGSGGCAFAPTSSSPAIGIVAAPGPAPVQGSPQTLVATLRNVPSPSDIPVTFIATGANPRTNVVRTDASGRASLSYAAVNTGTDSILAIAAIDGTTTVRSDEIRLTWGSGRHPTFLALNQSPRSGAPGRPFNAIASLTDLANSPVAPLAGQAVNFSLGSSTCTALTGPNGTASCELTAPDTGRATLGAQFAGTASLAGSTAAVGFEVMALVSEPDSTPPALNLPDAMTIEATGANGAVVNFTATASDAVDPNPAVSCTPPAGATFPLGTTSVSCTATDASGNTSLPGSFDVTVRDTSGPAFANVPANISAVATSASGAVVSYAMPTASDLVSGAAPVNCAPASGATFPIGTTQVACTASDATGNPGTVRFNVTVQNVPPPTGNQKTICTTLGHKGLADIDVFQFEAKANENISARIEASGSWSGKRATLMLLGVWALVTDSSDMPNSVTAKLPKKGSYFLKVIEDYFNKAKFTGGYCLTLESSMGAAQTLRQW